MDVTDEYGPVTDVKINLPNLPSNVKYAYICAFNNTTWNPIYYGEINNKQVIFKKMGRNIIYLPVISQNNMLYAVSSPIKITNDGNVEEIIVDKNNG